MIHNNNTGIANSYIISSYIISSFITSSFPLYFIDFKLIYISHLMNYFFWFLRCNVIRFHINIYLYILNQKQLFSIDITMSYSVNYCLSNTVQKFDLESQIAFFLIFENNLKQAPQIWQKMFKKVCVPALHVSQQLMEVKFIMTIREEHL